MLQVHKPYVMLFYAGWSGPCQAFKPVLERALMAYNDGFQPLKCYDTDETPTPLLAKWKVLGVPTAILVSRYDRELGRLIGYNKEEYVINMLRRGVL